MKGEESLNGSSSPVAGDWAKTGGGSFLRVGVHPLSGVLYLKQVEAKARGEAIVLKSVLADTGTTTRCLLEHEHRHINARPIDVEDFANVTVTFSDGTKAIIISTDVVLGGTKNYIEIYSNDSALICNITPTDILNTYFLGGVYTSLRQNLQPKRNTPYLHCGCKSGKCFGISCCYSPPSFQGKESILNQVPCAVNILVIATLLFSISPRWNDSFNANCNGFIQNFVAVIAPICQ